MSGRGYSHVSEPAEASSNRIIASVGRKLKYYIDVKRREDGFDLSSAYHPRMIYPAMKKRLVVMYDGARRSVPSMKHNFADKEIRRRLTHLSLEEKVRPTREIAVEEEVEDVMEKTVVRDYFVPHGYCQRDQFGNIVVVNRLKDLQYGTSGYGGKQKNPFPGGYPLLRSVASPFVSQTEAARLLNVASKIIACTELTAPDKDKLMQERRHNAGLDRTPRSERRSKSATPRHSGETVVRKGDAPDGLYEVTVKTGNENGSSTTAPVFLILHGSDGRSEKIGLTGKRGPTKPFQKGSTDKFEFKLPHVGRLHYITIGHESDLLQNAWFLESVVVVDHKSGHIVTFNHKKFLRAPHNVADLMPSERAVTDSSDDKDEQSRTEESVSDRSSDDDRNRQLARTSSVPTAAKNNFFDAIRRNDRDAIVQLLNSSNGPQLLHCRTTTGMGPLHTAAAEGADDVLKVLIRNGADVDVRTEKNGFSPLHFAASSKRARTVELLLSLGANPLALSSFKAAPLHLAALSGDLGTCRALLTESNRETFAAMSFRDGDGCRPVDVARENRNYDIEDLLNKEAASLEASVTGEKPDEFDMEMRGKSAVPPAKQYQPHRPVVSVTIPSTNKKSAADDDFYKDA